MEENKQPILSICVPTYNREKCLRRLLDSIVFQKEFIDTNDVEVVISDNASTDSTKELVNEYVKKY
jgi:glycosyltransferase involved in cell wall biosynthesis